MSVATGGDIGLVSAEDPDEEWTSLLRLTPSGAMRSFRSIRGSVISYVLTEPNGAIVLTGGHRSPRLVILDKNDVESEIAVPEELDDQVTGLHVDGAGRVYLAATRQTGLVLTIDLVRRSLRPFARWDWGGGPLVIDARANLQFPTFDATTGMRSWVVLDPALGKLTEHRCGQDLYEFVIHPIGVSADGYAYASSRFAVRRFTQACTVDWSEQFDNIVPDTDRSFWTCTRTGTASDTISLRRWHDGGHQIATEVILRLPDELVGFGGWRLVSVNSRHEFTLSVGRSSPPGTPSLIYSGDGSLLGRGPRLDDGGETEFQLQPPGNWAVNGGGDLVLSLSGPSGVHVLAVTPE